MFPNTFIVGAPKCGTTALSKYLSEHEEVFFSVPKEPFYWCDDFRKSQHEPRIDSVEEYEQLFRDAKRGQHKIVAEGSTRYLQSETAVPRIMNEIPNAKIIAMIRNPVELVQAYHMEQRYSLHENIASFEEAWRAQASRARGERIPSRCREPALLQYGSIASLGEQIVRLKRTVPAEQLKIIVFDDFKSDTGGIYRDTLNFLGLSDDGRSLFEKSNMAHAHRYEWLARLVLSPPNMLATPMLRLRRHLLEKKYPPAEWVKRMLNQRKERAKIPPEFERELREFFKDDVDSLSKCLGRDLSHWVGEN